MNSVDRPRPLWHHSRSGLGGLSIVSWRVDADLLAARLPPEFEVVTHRHVGGKYGVVSMVSFVDLDYHFRFLPLIQLSCGQINYRTYVRHRGVEGVYFFGTSLDSRLVGIPRALWQMPWHRDDVSVHASWDGDRPVRYRVEAVGRWGTAEVSLGDRASPAAGLETICGTGELSARYVDPFRGWYQRRDGRIGEYSVWHGPMVMTPMSVEKASAAPFTGLGLVNESDLPIDARVTKRVTFDVHTPPRKEQVVDDG